MTIRKTKNYLAIAARQTMREIKKRLLISLKIHLRKAIPRYPKLSKDAYNLGFCEGWNECRKEILNELERLIDEPTKI